MKLPVALVGLAAFGGVAVCSFGSSAMPIGVPSHSETSVARVGYICDVWGRCWWRPYYGYYGVPAYSGTYFAPRYDGGWQYRRALRRWSPQGAIRGHLVG
jgi:hypothetical protein